MNLEWQNSSQLKKPSPVFSGLITIILFITTLLFIAGGVFSIWLLSSSKSKNVSATGTSLNIIGDKPSALNNLLNTNKTSGAEVAGVNTASPSPKSTFKPTPKPTVVKTPVPTPTATPIPTSTSEPTPSPTAEPTAIPEPTPSPTAEPTSTPTPTPVPTVTPDPAVTSSPSPTAEPSPEAS